MDEPEPTRLVLFRLGESYAIFLLSARLAYLPRIEIPLFVLDRKVLLGITERAEPDQPRR